MVLYLPKKTPYCHTVRQNGEKLSINGQAGLHPHVLKGTTWTSLTTDILGERMNNLNLFVIVIGGGGALNADQEFDRLLYVIERYLSDHIIW